MTENKLAVLANESGIEKTKSQRVLEQFQVFFEQASEWEKKAADIIITDPSQTEEMKLARSARLNLKEIRVNAEKTKKSLKAGILVEGRLIDAMYNTIAGVVKPIEDSLLEKEKFVERMEAERLAKLRDERAGEIESLGIDPSPYPLDKMSDEAYKLLVDNFRFAKKAREDAERKTEEERVAREKAEAEERERKAREDAEERARIQAENARLQAEAEERERQIAEERAKAEAERKAVEEAARKEREERERKEAEERARHEEEIRKKEEEAAAARAELERVEREKREAEEAELRRIEEEKKAEAARIEALEKAGDKKKLELYFDALLSSSVPSLKSDAAKKIIKDHAECLQRCVSMVQKLK